MIQRTFNHSESSYCLLKNLFKLLIIGVMAMFCSTVSANSVELPSPLVDTTPKKGEQKIVLAGGCFWGIQGVFQHMKGVIRATSGYAGGAAETANYNSVGRGTTGHAEVVEVVYDASKLGLGQILKVFFSVAHDPTELNRQGPDVGTQYRSAIFYTDTEQEKTSAEYIAQLNKINVFSGPIVTQLVPLKAFYTAEAYHQDYMRLNPDNRYIQVHDAPKLANLKKIFPELYRE